MFQATLKSKDDIELLVILVFFSIPLYFSVFYSERVLLLIKKNTDFFFKVSKIIFNFLPNLYTKVYVISSKN